MKKLLIRRTGAILGMLRAEYRQVANRYFGTIERFDGNAKDVCAQIVEKLWEGNFYRTSLGHFDFFWMRDFGTVAESLVNLGHQDKVHHTLRWAMHHYRRAGTTTLCIDKAGNTFNAPAKKSVDALPWLLHSLVVSNYPLNKAEHAFLQTRLRHYTKKFLDTKTGMLRPVRYAEMRDAVNYDRSAYSIALIGRLAACAEKLKLDAFIFPPELYQKILLEQYWNGEFFKADLSNNVYSSECALIPFFLHVVNDPAMAEKTFAYIERRELNRPYPLKYSEYPNRFNYRLGMGPTIMPNYTGSTIWTWHATFYLHLLKRYKSQAYNTQYARFAELIERHGNYPELVNPNGSWYKAPFYMADPGMVWAALFLELPTKLHYNAAFDEELVFKHSRPAHHQLEPVL
jgi:hypothetical protein